MRDVTVRLIRIRIRGWNPQGGDGSDVAGHLAAALPSYIASALGEGGGRGAASVPALSIRVPQSATADVMAAGVARALGERLRGRTGNDAP